MAAVPMEWMMLEPFVFRRDEDSSFPDDRTAPFRAEGISSHGGPFTVAFRVVGPPAISRFYLKWPGGPKAGSSCDIVAAHRNLLLFRLTSNPVKGKDEESLIWPQEYFICQGSLHQPTLQLHRIPMFTQRSLHLRSVGILCRPEEKFVVAQLRLSETRLPAKMEAELCVLRSNKWELLRNLQIKYEAHELSDLIHWRTDRVIPFENYLCWVSYFSGGTLFCDVSEKKPKISHHRLPIHGRCRGADLHRLRDMNCSLCTTDSGGKLMFINVAPEDHEIVGPMLPGTDFIVTCHTWRTQDMVWEEAFVITSHEIWGFDASLSYNALMFPLVSAAKSNELYFLLPEKGERAIDKVSVIAVDTITKHVKIHQYIEGEEDLGGEDDDMVRRKSRLLHPFVPTEFPKFFWPHQVFRRCAFSGRRCPPPNTRCLQRLCQFQDLPASVSWRCS
ncbi:uncharacterized protein [Triticum aestivum]|uniref:uncharacterized protein isoform X2 n=1 Tax=Triticum aestivum TaxID=4565 RepID=UPI001D021AE6|nr:uncharacterized protein LOC123041389 isoform X2 [Triticum aestivum]